MAPTVRQTTTLHGNARLWMGRPRRRSGSRGLTGGRTQLGQRLHALRDGSDQDRRPTRLPRVREISPCDLFEDE